MDPKKLVNGVLESMGAGVSAPERNAIVATIHAAEAYGYGNLIAWLATGWAASLRENGCPKADPADFAGGRCYRLPPNLDTR